MAYQGDTTATKDAPFLEEVREAAEQLVDEQKVRAADLVKGVAETLRRTAQALDEQQIGVAARYADRAAGEVDRWSDAVRNRSLGSLAGEAEALARKEPEWFIAGAVAAGFLLGRVLRAAGRKPVETAFPLDPQAPEAE